MLQFPTTMQKLVRELSRLPSIGEKSASRLAYHLIQNDPKLAHALADAMRNAVETIKLCNQCYFFTEQEQCSICTNPERDNSIICVVEKPMDIIAIERISEFKGLYHVLHGLWAPLRGMGPESMKIQELVKRIKAGGIRETIIATGSTVEGDATALYLSHLLSEHGVLPTRLAQGMPKGGELEYADDVTLSRAFTGRSPLGG